MKLSDLKRTGKLLFMHPWELGEDIAGYIITQKFVPLFNAFVKVLSWGLGPHLVLILHKSPHFPILL